MSLVLVLNVTVCVSGRDEVGAAVRPVLLFVEEGLW